MRGTIFILLLLCNFISAQTNQTETGPCPDQREWTGIYSNPKLGFAFTIPSGLKAYWNSAPCVPEGKDDCACLTDFGRTIPLCDDATISVTGSWEIDADRSTLDLEKNELKILREEKTPAQFKLISSHWFKLQNLSTRRFSVQFIESGKLRITEYVVGINEGVSYYLVLRTTPDNLPSDQKGV